MAYTRLDEFKRHLNIDECYTDDDVYLMSLIDIAEDAVQKHLNIDFKKAFRNRNKLPDAISMQVKILGATFYSNREGTGSQKQLNQLSYDYLSGLNKNYSDTSCHSYKKPF